MYTFNNTTVYDGADNKLGISIVKSSIDRVPQHRATLMQIPLHEVINEVIKNLPELSEELSEPLNFEVDINLLDFEARGLTSSHLTLISNFSYGEFDHRNNKEQIIVLYDWDCEDWDYKIGSNPMNPEES